MDFLGEEYAHDGATYMVEITYRPGDRYDEMSDSTIYEKIVEGLKAINFAAKSEDISLINLTRHQYAYVIYDLNHKSNMDKIREYFAEEGVWLNGRFGNYEYWNMDKVIRESLKLVERI